jgi:mono/diheme cytochrome c family protein
LSLRSRLSLLFIMVMALAGIPVVHVWAAPAPKAISSYLGPGNPVKGKALYRKYCGNCHALKEALAAGFGGNSELGQDGGPSFNDLRVPANLSVVAVTEDFGGHEVVVKKMTWDQIYDVAAFAAQATRSHKYLARVSDG